MREGNERERAAIYAALLIQMVTAAKGETTHKVVYGQSKFVV